MNVPRDPDAILAAWLEEGPTRLPESTRRAIAVATRTTHQTRRPMRVPWRFPTMNGLTKLALGALAVVAFALGGLYLINPMPQSGVGGPSATPTPTPTPSPSPRAFDAEPLGGLTPGAYVLESVEPLRITFTVPAGWQKNAAPNAVWSAGSEAHVGFAAVDNLYVDPCAADLAKRTPPVGPTVDDLAAAFDTVPGLDATAREVTLAGYSGKQVDLTAIKAWEPCPAGEATLFVNEGGVDSPPPGPDDRSRLVDSSMSPVIDW